MFFVPMNEPTKEIKKSELQGKLSPSEVQIIAKTLDCTPSYVNKVLRGARQSQVIVDMAHNLLALREASENILKTTATSLPRKKSEEVEA